MIILHMLSFGRHVTCAPWAQHVRSAFCMHHHQRTHGLLGVQELLRLEGAADQAEQVVAVEEDVQMLYEAWHKLCDPLVSFHSRTKELELPADKVEEFATDFAEPGLPQHVCASPGDSSTSVEEILPFEHVWLAHLLNAFGAKRGFELVCQVRCSATP